MSIEDQKQICTTFAEFMVAVHEDLSSGTEWDRYRRELEVELAGSDRDEAWNQMFLNSALVANMYHEKGLAVEDLRIDFLHPCVTERLVLVEVLERMWIEHNPEARESEQSARELRWDENGVLDPRDYRKLLGEDLEGLAVLSVYERRSDGEISACGVEFAHMDYEDIYSMGATVKTSGSVSFSEHRVAGVAALLKLKGEDIRLTRVADRSPPDMTASVFDIRNVYMTKKGRPFKESKASTFECEDSEYICMVEFDFPTAAEAIFEDELGFAYSRKDGSTDVVVELTVGDNQEFGVEIAKLIGCMAQLAKQASKNLESNSD
ncbi:MAG: hypothetical protein RJQ07_07995 [Pseudomonadales bacterium]